MEEGIIVSSTCLFQDTRANNVPRSAFLCCGIWEKALVYVPELGCVVRTGVGPFGMRSHAIAYTSRPPTNAPGKIENTIQRTRIGVASTSKYSASPPQTPAIFASAVERVSRGCAVSARVPDPSGMTIQTKR